MKLAELTGAMIGDGCISILRGRRKRKIALLTGHLQHDFDYYANVIRPIVRSEFGSNGYLQKRPSRNCVYFVMGNPVFDFFTALGFPIGEKTNLRIPEIILQDQEWAKACVRGIFDTDGTIYRRYSKQYTSHRRLYDHLVIQFKLDSREVIAEIQHILKHLGMVTNQIIPESNCSVLRITKQEDVKKFMETIKPSNTYHVERYINRCKEPTSHGPLAQLVEHS